MMLCELGVDVFCDASAMGLILLFLTMGVVVEVDFFSVSATSGGAAGSG
jgi:hypothetical protein